MFEELVELFQRSVSFLPHTPLETLLETFELPFLSTLFVEGELGVGLPFGEALLVTLLVPLSPTVLVGNGPTLPPPGVVVLHDRQPPPFIPPLLLGFVLPQPLLSLPRLIVGFRCVPLRVIFPLGHGSQRMSDPIDFPLDHVHLHLQPVSFVSCSLGLEVRGVLGGLGVGQLHLEFPHAGLVEVRSVFRLVRSHPFVFQPFGGRTKETSEVVHLTFLLGEDHGEHVHRIIFFVFSAVAVGTGGRRPSRAPAPTPPPSKGTDDVRILQKSHERTGRVSGFVHLRDEIVWHLSTKNAEGDSERGGLGCLEPNGLTQDVAGEITQVIRVEGSSRTLGLMEWKL